MTIWTIAKTTVGEAMRKKVLNILLIVALAMIVLSLSFSQLGFKQDMTVTKSLGLFVILLAGFIISILMSISLIPNEVDRRTIYTILSKPVRRYEFLLGKFLGGLVTLFINVMAMGIVFVGMVALKAYIGMKTGQALTQGNVPLPAGVAGGFTHSAWQILDPALILGVVFVFVQFMILSAVVMLFSVFMTPTVNFFASTSVYILGTAAQVWKAMADSSNPQTPGLVKVLYSIIYHVLPNFDLFNIQNRLIHPQFEVRSFPIYVCGVTAYAIVYSSIVMIVAIIAFDRKEV
jgi:ABC-type transport system involved in multi-copper enzyme maturation permease subunit